MKKITQIPGSLYACEDRQETAFIICMIGCIALIAVAFYFAMYGINPAIDWMGL